LGAVWSNKNTTFSFQSQKLFSFCLPSFPFGAVQSIPASRSINCAICNQFQVFAISSMFQVFQPFSVSRFRAKTSFSVPYYWDWESRIPICCFKPLQWLQRSRPPVPQTYCRQRSAQPSSSPPRPSSSPQASQPSSPPSSASSPSADSSPFCPTSS